jgi:hypothetical protein
MTRPEQVWSIDHDYEELYASKVADGRAVAAEMKLAIVAIARNSMPHLTNTFSLLDEVARGFKEWTGYVYENDSTDGTAEELDRLQMVYPWMNVDHDTLGGIDARGFEPERTVRLAACRNRCLQWVRENAADSTFTLVVDTDPHHGFSVDGVFNSVAWLAHLRSRSCPQQAGCMASFSLGRTERGVFHYDAWAARANWWRDRKNEIGFTWFSAFMPPVGSPPIAMNSAFGGLALYWTEAYLSGGYSGEDCEHVPHHRRMAEAGWQVFLNPGSRYIAIWNP